ncbi:MAG: glycosyl hydrolase family 28 protein [Monoglobales bacterium]
MVYNVKNFGAKANGVETDTSAIQNAVDECSRNGGGRVLIPAGEYLAGKVILKDNVTVEIAEGATILASANPEDYPATSGPENSLFKNSKIVDGRSRRVAVFYACEAKNIGIVGRGTVDGRFKLSMKTGIDGSWNPKYRWISDGRDYDIYRPVDPMFRPLLVFIEACEDVRLDGVNYINAPCYTLQFRSSERINISDVNIKNNLGANNSDGIHFSSCKDVRIINCDLICGDDAIAIDSNDGTPSENFAISNCIFTSRNNCFRIFTCLGNQQSKRELLKWGRVSDISISNCVARSASSFVYINVDQGEAERISITNITGKIDKMGTCFLMTAHGAKIKGVTLSNWNLVSNGVGYIYTDTKNSISNIKISNFNVKVCPTTKVFGNGFYMPTTKESDGVVGLPFYWLSHFAPYFLQIFGAKNLSLSSVLIEWGQADIDDIEEIADTSVLPENWPRPFGHFPAWPAIMAECVENLKLNDVTCSAFGDYESAIELLDVRDATISGCPENIAVYSKNEKTEII